MSRMENFDIPRIGVACIVLKEGKVLLGKRKAIRGAGHWACPGGHLEFGETIEACAKRELLEETGIEAVSLRIIDWIENPAEIGDRHYVTFFAIVEEFLGEPKNMEPDKNEEWFWFGWDELPTPLFATIPRFLKKCDVMKLLYSE